MRTCTSTASTLVNGVGDRIMWTARLEPGGTTTVWICCDAQYTEAAAPTPTPTACTTAAATIAIDTSLPAYKEGDAARPRCQCITSSGSQAVRVTESR